MPSVPCFVVFMSTSVFKCHESFSVLLNNRNAKCFDYFVHYRAIKYMQKIKCGVLFN